MATWNSPRVVRRIRCWKVDTAVDYLSKRRKITDAGKSNSSPRLVQVCEVKQRRPDFRSTAASYWPGSLPMCVLVMASGSIPSDTSAAATRPPGHRGRTRHRYGTGGRHAHCFKQSRCRAWTIMLSLAVTNYLAAAAMDHIDDEKGISLSRGPHRGLRLCTL